MQETKFIQTEVGRIPEDWEVRQLGDLLTIGNGRDYKYLSMGDVPVFGTGGLMCFVNDFLYNGETVCIGRKGTINMPFYHYGKIWTVDTLFYTHSFKNVIPKYIYYLFLTIDWHGKNEATGVPSLTKVNIEKIKVFIPPLAEQERIASALTAADNLIASLDKQIAKTRNLKQATMQHLLSSLPIHSPLKPLGEVAEIDKGVQFNRVNMSEKGTFPVFNGGINASGYIEQYNQNENTMTVSQGGASAGYVNWQIEKFWAGAHCYVIKPIVEVSNKYLYYFIKYNEVTFMNSKHGGNIPGLAIKFLLDFLIPIPPIEEQERIASILTTMDNQIAALEKKRSKYEMVKQGMMQQLLTGTIRLT